MYEAVFILFVASGLCLTFSAITAFYAIRTLQDAKLILSFAGFLLRRNYDIPEKPEGSA